MKKKKQKNKWKWLSRKIYNDSELPKTINIGSVYEKVLKSMTLCKQGLGLANVNVKSVRWLQIARLHCPVCSASDTIVRDLGLDTSSSHIFPFLLPLIQEEQLSVNGERVFLAAYKAESQLSFIVILQAPTCKENRLKVIVTVDNLRHQHVILKTK